MSIGDNKPKAPVSVDWPLAGAAFALSFIGLLNLASAAPTGSFWHRQLFSMAIGFAAMVGISGIDFRTINRYAYFIFGATLFLVFVTLLYGTAVSGSKAWIRIGMMSIQPSEFAKIGAIMAVSKFFHDQRLGGPYGLYELRGPVFLLSIPIFLIMLQPDTGTALMLICSVGTIMLFAGIKRYIIITTVVAALALAPLTWKILLPHQKNRIMAFINPESDPTGIGYNAIQSMVAIGSGKIIGKGYKLGTQTALKYLPERHSDFAFSVLGEEWGFIGGLAVLGLFLFIVLWALKIASTAKDRFSCFVAVGIAALLFWHTVVNVAMTLGSFPVIGIPLPFLSYGGTFVVTIYAAIGLLMSIEGRRFKIS